MKRHAVFVVFGLALYDCNFLGPDLDCRGTIIDHLQLDFEGACTGDNCSLMTLGSTESVPSLLPGDHALALDAAASATWTLSIAGNGEGTSLAMSFRCDEGGTLLLGVQGSGGTSMNVGATADWQRRVWPVTGATTSFETMAGASAGRHQAVVWVSNSGRARCVIDWLRFVAAPRVCGNSSACSTLSRTFCNGFCADLRSDNGNCGACGMSCGGGTVCEGGRCVSGSGFCPNACYERECGPNRCGLGSCGDCPSGLVCSGLGQCVPPDAGVWDVPVRDVLFTEAATVSRTSVVAGRRCNDDEACVSDTADLVCTALPGGRVCTNAECEQGTRAQEEVGCGGLYSTCLVVGNFTNGTQASACTRACVATASTEATGACPTGSVCTTNWIQLTTGQTENAGCLPFCASDGDCTGLTAGDASLMRCNVRTGRCGTAPFDAASRADGTPCDPQEIERTMVSQCRGTCFALSPLRPTQGLCGSLINQRTATGGCPDGAEFEPRYRSGDNMGLCIVRNCERDDQCAPGLACVYPEDSMMGVRTDLPRTCGYPTALQPGGTTGDAGVRADVAMD